MNISTIILHVWTPTTSYFPYLLICLLLLQHINLQKAKRDLQTKIWSSVFWSHKMSKCIMLCILRMLYGWVFLAFWFSWKATDGLCIMNKMTCFMFIISFLLLSVVDFVTNEVVPNFWVLVPRPRCIFLNYFENYSHLSISNDKQGLHVFWSFLSIVFSRWQVSTHTFFHWFCYRSTYAQLRTLYLKFTHAFRVGWSLGWYMDSEPDG